MFMYINEVMCSSARPTIAKPCPFPDFYPVSAAVFTQTLHRSPSEYFIEILCYTTCVFLVVFFITLLTIPINNISKEVRTFQHKEGIQLPVTYNEFKKNNQN